MLHLKQSAVVSRTILVRIHKQLLTYLSFTTCEFYIYKMIIYDKMVNSIPHTTKISFVQFIYTDNHEESSHFS